MKDQQNQNNEFGDNWIQTFDHDTDGWDKKLPPQPTSNGLLVFTFQGKASKLRAKRHVTQ